MSSQSARVVCETVASWLREMRPAETVGEIRDMGSTETRTRPEIVVICNEGDRPHPKLCRYDLTLRGEWLPKEETTPGAFTAGFAALSSVLTDPANFQDLRMTLATRGMLLRTIRAGADIEEPEDESSRRLTLPVTVWVQMGV